jgi:hypothetical protein
MNILRFVRFVSAASLASALYAACGGSVSAPEDTSSGVPSASSGSGSSSSSVSTSGTTSSGGVDAGLPGECTGPGQCALAFLTCCAPCIEYGLDDVIPLHEDQVGPHYSDMGCDDLPACPPCVGPPNPDLFAYCEGGQCVEADMGVHPLNECAVDADCKLRYGLACCECGAEGLGLTAIPVNAQDDLAALVCKPDQGCLECAPTYPANASPFCDAGRCTVAFAL